MSANLSKVKNRRRKSKNEESITKLLKNRTKRMRLILLLVGISLVFFGLNWPRKEEIRQEVVVEGENTSFSNEPVKIDSGLTKERNERNLPQPPIRITIPDLSIDIPVKEAKVVKGYWEVFPDSAGFGLGSAYPQEEGNQVIFAHARDNLFGPLKNAKTGQDILVFTKDKWYSYKIREIKEVLPDAIDVIAPTKEAVLTLYTCSGFADSKRLIVIADRNPV